MTGSVQLLEQLFMNIIGHSSILYLLKKTCSELSVQSRRDDRFETCD